MHIHIYKYACVCRYMYNIYIYIHSTFEPALLPDPTPGGTATGRSALTLFPKTLNQTSAPWLESMPDSGYDCLV